MDTLQLLKQKGRCCITGKPLKNCKNLNWVQLNVLATWSYPVWGNILTKLSNLAVAFVHDDCYDDPQLKEKIINAVEVRGDEIVYHPVKDLQKVAANAIQVINMTELRDALPKRAKVTVKKEDKQPYLEFTVDPALADSDFEMVLEWHSMIIGVDNISSITTKERGRHWLLYLAKKSFEFTGLSLEEINELTGINFIPPDQTPEA